jgi:tetratricopeptide (TPR) repeat protein
MVLLGMTLNNLAVAYNSTGQSEKALELYERSLAIKLQVYGENSKEAVIGYNNVGVALRDQKLFTRAVASLEHARETAIALNLRESRIWPHLVCNCGDVHRALGRFAEAEKELMEALHVREKTKNSKDLEESYHCLGKYYRDMKDYRNGEKYFQQALRLREKQYGIDHYKVCQTLEEYALLLREAARESEAEQMEARAASIREKLRTSR